MGAGPGWGFRTGKRVPFEGEFRGTTKRGVSSLQEAERQVGAEGNPWLAFPSGRLHFLTSELKSLETLQG